MSWSVVFADGCNEVIDGFVEIVIAQASHGRNGEELIGRFTPGIRRRETLDITTRATLRSRL